MHVTIKVDVSNICALNRVLYVILREQVNEGFRVEVIELSTKDMKG